MQNKQSKEQKLNRLRTVKKKGLASGTIIALVLLVSPYLFYLYQGFPDTQHWESFFGVYESRYYESVQVMGWVLFGKLVPFLLLLIWFFTCKHWWYHSILVPLCMYLIQIINTLNEDIEYTDSNDFFLIAPIVFVMAIFSYTIRTRVFDKIHGIDLSELSRVNWKGEIVTKEEEEAIIDSEEEHEDVFMG